MTPKEKFINENTLKKGKVIVAWVELGEGYSGYYDPDDPSVRLDYRFESWLDDVWNRNMQEIFAKLFR